MRILLVTPRNPESFWTYDSILPVIGKHCIFPNLSMPTVAGLTEGDHEILLVDENVEDLDYEIEADIVGITGYIVHKARMLEMAAEFRRRGRFVVIGGPYASLCPEELRGHCDVLFIDEAEETWPQFLRDFQAGAWKTEYRPAEKPDMTLSPRPRFDLIKLDRYHAATVQFARGCPFRCEFCDIIVVYGRRPRVKSVPQVMAEIEEIHRLGGRQCFLVDDNFIGNKNVAKAFLRELAAWSASHGHPMSFQTEVSLNVAHDEELLGLMRAANFTTIFIGIESPRAASLEETGKHQNTRGDMLEDIRRIQSYGLQVQAGMIVGFDADDHTIFEDQLRFIQEARIPISMTGMLQAMPKTPLHARVSREGRLVAESTGDQFVFSNIVPKGMSRLDLYRGYRRLIRELYDFDNFRRRTADFLMTRGAQVNQGRIEPRDLVLLWRVLRHTVFRADRARRRFSLRLMAGTLWRRPQAFKEACSFALTHKAMAEYMEQLGAKLDVAIAALEAETPAERVLAG